MYKYETLFDMYENDKVPMEHRVPKIYADKWHALEKLVRTEEELNVWRLYFSDISGEETCLCVSFPDVDGIRIANDKPGYFTCGALDINYCENNRDRVAYADNGYSAHLISGSIFRLELKKDNKVFFVLDNRTVSYGYTDGKRIKAALTVPIHENEKISGFGEKYNGLNQVGKLLPIHNDDTGYHGHTEAGDKCRSYKNVPIYHSSTGYTLFYNSFYSAVADLTGDNNSTLRMDYNSFQFDIYVWAGTIIESLDCYTRLTGRPILPHKWALEFWAGGNGHIWDSQGKENYAKVFKEAVDGYERMGTIPSAFYGEGSPSQHEDCYDMVHKIGSRMLAWNHPGVDIMIEGYNVERIREMFPGIKDEDIPMLHDAATGEIFDRSLFYMDYSHPKIMDVMRNKYDKFWKLGLKGAMVDFGEFVQQYTLAYNGMTGEEMHNYYAYCYSKTMHDIWQEHSPEGDYILFARAGCAGVQKWIGFFGGDQRGEFYGMRQAYYGGLNAAQSGLTVWGSDIGSLSSCDSEELYLRWLQFGAFSPLMRTHGNHNAWNYSEHCVEVFKKYFWLRKNLLDYVYSTAVESHLTGIPYMRIMSACYPEDARLRMVDDQYMFGDSLMVCPVLYQGVTEREVVFPAGDWYDLYTGKHYKGGTSAKVKSPIETCPAFVKGGAVIPVTLSESLELTAPIEGDGVNILLAAVGNGKTEHWVSDEVFYKFTAGCDNGIYTLCNENGYVAAAVLVYGDVKQATADGLNLDIDCKNGVSVVKLPDNKWKELKINV